MCRYQARRGDSRGVRASATYSGGMRRAWLTWALTWVGVLIIAAFIAYFPDGTSKRLLVFAASILLLTSVLHSVLGERFILQPLFRRNDLPTLFGDPVFVARTLRFVWHLFSIAFVGLAGILIAVAAQASDAVLTGAVSAAAAASAVVTAAISRGRHFSWVAFAAVAIATWLAP